jgi:hypothetical protein
MFSKKPLIEDEGISDKGFKIEYLSSKMGILGPADFGLHTVRVTPPLGTSRFFWRIKVHVTALENLLRMAKKILPENVAAELDDEAWKTFYGEVTYKG